MAVVNSFVQWQKDTFFSAAEEVQNSADAMESMYRMWLRERNEGYHADGLIELRRELQTTLGTAKWQLEEFERAVRESHRRWPGDESSATRHNQFIQAMEEQISEVEIALGESLADEGREPLRWIQLDEEERNDLALFLTASPVSKPADAYSPTCSREVIPFKNHGSSTEGAKQISERSDEMSEQVAGAWKIVIAGEESKEMKSSESRLPGFVNLVKLAKFAPKAKWFRSSLEKTKNLEDRPINKSTSCSELAGITRVSQRTKVTSERSGSCLGDLKEDVISHLAEAHRQAPDHLMQLKRSLRIAGLLAVTMLLIVPFVLYST